MKTPEKKSGNRTVWDEKNTPYELTGKIGEGGQGMVCSTQYPNVLVKVSKHPSSDPQTRAWHKHVQWVARQPLENLHIARPQAMIVKPRPGYVMELMDGLEPLQAMLDSSFNALRDGNGLTGFRNTGGLSRRVRVLARLARLLASLHGRALAYGDLSPTNIFVSRSHEHAEVWLIDCDNVSVLCREGGQKIYTREYGAPEVLRRDSGINSLTDSWSFAVIAFQMLTLLHPLMGDLVDDGDPDLVEQARRGDFPWIDHLSDDRNRASHGLSRADHLTTRLRAQFEQCFNVGMHEPGERPSMAAWAEAFEAAEMMLALCSQDDGCGSSFFFNTRRQCPFCDFVQAPERFLVLRHFVYAPLSDLGEGAKGRDQWLPTQHYQLVSDAQVELRSSPIGSSFYVESPVVGRLDLVEQGLWIEPLSSHPMSLQRDKSVERVKRRMLLKTEWKKDSNLVLHLGDVGKAHAAWRFKW